MKRNIEIGHLLQILDFAMSFRNIQQNEVQSAHWDGTLTTIHAIINYFKCMVAGCNETVTLILAQISEDQKHDSFLARACQNEAFKYLAETRYSNGFGHSIL